MGSAARAAGGGPAAGSASRRSAANVDKAEVKGLEKLTSIRLAEVLSHKNVVAADAITDALYAQDQHGEPFVDVLVSSGRITEWDLAKVVVEHFQVPFIMAGNYDIGAAARDRLPETVLFQSLVVPLDVFGDAVSLVMPILTPFEALDSIQREFNCDVFPYVGLISENKKVMKDLFPKFQAWQTQQEQQREQRRRTAPQEQRSDWMNIFDNADEAIRSQKKR